MANIVDKNREEPVDLKPVEVPGMGRPEDSRLKGYFGKVTHPSELMERTYCTKCGAPYGFVAQESMEHIRVGSIIVLCEKCEAELNALGGVPMEVAAGKEATHLPDPALRSGSLPSTLDGSLIKFR